MPNNSTLYNFLISEGYILQQNFMLMVHWEVMCAKHTTSEISLWPQFSVQELLLWKWKRPTSSCPYSVAESCEAFTVTLLLKESVELKLLFKTTLPTGKHHISGLVCFAHHFMPVPSSVPGTKNTQKCMQEGRKEKARVFIRFPNFHPSWYLY